MHMKCDRAMCVCVCVCVCMCIYIYIYIVGIKVLHEAIFHGAPQVELCFPFSYPHFLKKINLVLSGIFF